MKKRILSLLLALVMILSIMSVSAYAAEIKVSAINIENLRTPLAGSTPDFDCDLVSTRLVFKQTLDGYNLINGMIWYDLGESATSSESKKITMKKTDTFELGHKYRVHIFVMPNNSSVVFADGVASKIYEMNSDTEGMTTGKTASVVTPTGNTNKDYKVAVATYECTKSAIGTVEITGLKLPKHGEAPDDDCNVLTEGVSVNNAGGKVEWYCDGSKLNPATDTFEAGKKYKLSLWLRADYKNGCWFITDKNGENSANVNINGIPVNEFCDTYDYDYIRGIELEFYVPYTTISRFDVVGIDSPVAGFTPDFEGAPTTAGYDITNIYWVDETLRDELIAGGMAYVDAAKEARLTKDNGKVFEPGHNYRVNVDFKVWDGFEIDYDSDDILDYAATVNGKDAVEGSDYRGAIEAGFYYQFGTPYLQKISYIKITGIDTPVTGNVPDYEAVCAENTYTIKNMSWNDRTVYEALKAEGKTHAEAYAAAELVTGDGKTFRAGHTYRVNLEIRPDKNHEIDYDPADEDVLYYVAFINGEEAKQSSGRKGDNAMIFYDFPTTFYKAVTEITADGFAAPATGNTADVVGTVTGTGVEVKEVYWYDLTVDKKLEANGKFEAGHSYKLLVTLKTDENHMFAIGADNFPDSTKLTVKINGNAAVVEASGGTKEATISYTYNHSCQFTLVKEVAATESSAGKRAYYTCACGKNAEDAEGKTLITNIAAWGIIPELEVTTQPTTQPTTVPSTQPTTVPTTAPAVTQPTTEPTTVPTTTPTTTPSTAPVTQPTTQAPTTIQPTTQAPVVAEPTTVPSTTVHTHKEIAIPAVAATYTKNGLTEGKKCSECGEILVSQKTVARKKLKKVSSLKKTAVTLAKSKKSTLTLSWKKVTGAEKYEVYQYVNKKWKKIKTTSKTTYKVTKLTADKSYKFKVRAVAGTNKGSYSSVLTTKTVPLTTSLTVKAGKKQLTASWKKVANITGYEVQYSTSKKFTKKTTKTSTIKKAKTTKKTIKSLKKGKKYYVRVRAYKTVDGKKVYSAWSGVKSVKVK